MFVAQLIEPTPILPRATTGGNVNVLALAKYDATLNQALFQAFMKIANRLNNALMKDGSEGMTGLMVTTPATATIASGVIAATSSYMIVDTEAAGASDDLDTINGGVDGAHLYLRAANAGRTVVVKDGTGNIQGPGDFSLDNSQDTCHLIYDATLAAWLVVSTSNNGA